MTTTSARAIGIRDVQQSDQPISEQFRIVAKQQVEADGAASLMEEMKTTTLEQMKSQIVKDHDVSMADNKAERLAKCTPEWTEYLRTMVSLRTKANLLKAQCEYLRMREREADRMGWYERTERKMGRSAT
jgi:hypothetical protein